MGDQLDPEHYRATTVADRLESLLTSPAVAGRCREIAGRFDQARPLALASELIESMLQP